MKRNAVILCFLAGLSGSFMPSLSYAHTDEAGETIVTTAVSASASTGGNQGSGSQGTSTAKVFVETVVNGETVKHIDQTNESFGGEPVAITVESRYENGTTTAQAGISFGQPASSSDAVVLKNDFDPVSGAATSNMGGDANINIKALAVQGGESKKDENVGEIQNMAEEAGTKAYFSFYKGLAIITAFTIALYALKFFFI